MLRSANPADQKHATPDSGSVVSTTLNDRAPEFIRVIDAPVTRGFRRCQSRTIDTIVLHTICNPRARDKFSLASIKAIMNRYRAAAHYLILRDGTICRLVEEQDIAFHAGRSKMPVAPYQRYVNGNSLGIEMACDKKSSPTEAQYDALACLVKDIKSRYEIHYIFGHKDVAPKRKTDPWGFDWGRFNKMVTAETQKISGK